MEKSISFCDLRPGRDYLVNYYSLFEIDPAEISGKSLSEIKDLIKPVHRRLVGLYGPDKYAHLAPGLAAMATQVFLAIQAGYETLLDTDKLAAYDKILASWDGPISESGGAVYDASHYQKINRGRITDEDIEQTRNIMEQISGYNSKTHQVLQRLKDGKTSDVELITAYDDSLFHKVILVAMEEHLRFQQAGFEGREVVGDTPAGYLSEVVQQLDAFRAGIPDKARQLLLAAGQGSLKLLTEGGEDMTDSLLVNPEAGLSKLTIALTQRFNDAATKILELSEEREALYLERLSLLKGTYWPKQRKLRDKLIVGVMADEVCMWFPFVFANGVVSEDVAFNKQEVVSLKDDELLAKRFMKAGWNIMILAMREGIDFHVQLQHVVVAHFESYLDSIEEKE
jgi:hypothetical protein